MSALIILVSVLKPDPQNCVQKEPEQVEEKPGSPSEFLLAYASGQKVADAADFIQKLALRISALEGRVTQLQEVESSARLLERRFEALKAYTSQLEECYRQATIGFRRHVADRTNVPEGQMEIGFVFDDAATQPDSSQPDAELAPPSIAADGQSSNGNRKARKRSSTGRRKLKGALPKVVLMITPPEVFVKGLANFKQIGVEQSSTIFYRRGGMVELVEQRGKFVPLGKDESPKPAVSTPATLDANAVVAKQELVLTYPQDCSFTRNPFPCGAVVRYFPPVDSHASDSTVLIASLSERPIAKAFADPSLLAHLITGKMDLHLPYYRQERELERLGLSVSRSNMVRWHFEVGAIAQRIAAAMWDQALQRSWFGMDATGTAIFDKEKYRHAHILTLVAPGDSVLFRYEPHYDSATVEKLFGGYTGTVVADASANHNIIFGPGAATEAGCWAHCRRYFVKAHRGGFRKQADEALAFILKLFRIEQDIALMSAQDRLRVRQEQSAPIIEGFFGWVDLHRDIASKDSPLGRACTYASNQREALKTFLSNGEIPIHNNASENALRRVVKGRRNWLFMYSDEHASRSCAIYSLVASCELHGIDPEFYLQEILTVAPSYPLHQLLELSPKYWIQTRQRLVAEGRLRYIDMGMLLGSKLGLQG